MGVNGILLLDKDEGWTSQDCVSKLRGILGERRIGHAGTLDPLATGLLVVLVGRATRAAASAGFISTLASGRSERGHGQAWSREWSMPGLRAPAQSVRSNSAASAASKLSA